MHNVGCGADRDDRRHEYNTKGIEPKLRCRGIESAGKIEKQAGIGPFFKTGEAWCEYADTAQDLSPTNEGYEIQGIAEVGHKLYGLWLHDDIANRGEHHKAGENDGSNPVNNLC